MLTSMLRPLRRISSSRLRWINFSSLLLMLISALGLVAVPALADTLTDADTVSFAPLANDVSIGLLQAILGNWKIATPDATMGPLFRSFNLGVLVFGACLFMYCSVEGILRSAEDGEVLGRKWGSFFVPLRMSAGMILLFPLSNGFSCVQLIVLWLATQGIGFADWGANKTIEGFVNSQGAAVSAQIVSGSDLLPLMSNIIRAEVCVAEYNRAYMGEDNVPLFGGPYIDGDTNTTFTNSYRKLTWGPVQGAARSALSPDKLGLISAAAANQCGSIEIANFNSIAGFGNGTGIVDSIGNNIIGTVSTLTFGSNMNAARSAVRIAHANAIVAAADHLRPAAVQFAKGQQSDLSGSTLTLAAALMQEGQAYSSSIATALSSNGGASPIPSTAEMNSAMKDMVANAGWSTLGTWFYQYTRINSELSKLTNYKPSFTAPDKNSDDSIEAALQSLDAAIVQSAANPITAKQIGDPGMPKTIGRAQGGVWGALAGTGSVVTDMTQVAAQLIGVNPSDKTNAIIQLKNLGDNIISAEEAGFAAIVAVKVGSKATPGGRAITAASSMLQKVGNATGPIGAMVGKAVDFITGNVGWVLESAGVFILVTITSFAIMLAFWLPMMPFILWLGSFMGWLIAVCEMVAAAPLFAAAHLHPEGEGMASRYGANGYMIIIEVFAKPILMVVGFFIAARFADPFLRFFSSLFFTSMQAANGDSFSGVVTGLVFTLMYVIICVSLVTRAFSLIHIIPNSVMRWIGGNGGMFDQAEQMAPELKGQVQNSMGNLVKVGEMAGVAKVTANRKRQLELQKRNDDTKV